MTFRAIIVEDEEISRSRLKRLLSEFRDDIQIIGEAADGPTAVEKIKALNPDLLFLDIQLPGLDGFEILGKLDLQPYVIFTTANDTQALNAFKTNAIDYLLKPIETESLERALGKLRKLASKDPQVPAGLSDILKALSGEYLSRVACKVGDKTFLVKIEEILYFHADQKYTTVQTSGKTYIVDIPLIDLEKRLNPKDFIRIHRATLVNVAWISEIRRSFDGKMKIVLLDKQSTELVASRMYADNLRALT